MVDDQACPIAKPALASAKNATKIAFFMLSVKPPLVLQHFLTYTSNSQRLERAQPVMSQSAPRVPNRHKRPVFRENA